MFILNCLVNQHRKQTLGWEVGLESKTMLLKVHFETGEKGEIQIFAPKKFQD